jgi:large subunit ribosomal protein L32
MPVPKRKTSKSRRDKRASSNSKLKIKSSYSICPTCQAAVSSHQVCSDCGYYKGQKVVQTKTDRMHKRGEELKSRQKESDKTSKVEPQEIKPEEIEEEKK